MAQHTEDRETTVTNALTSVIGDRGPALRLRRRARSWAARFLGVFFTALCLGVALPPTTASAHAELVSTVPSAGEVLATAPSSVQLTFDEPVFLVPDGFQLYDGSGASRPLVVSTQDATVRAALPGNLPRGSYVVGWRVVSDDSHPESGVLAFSIGQADATSPVVTESDSGPVNVLYQGLNALGYLGLFTLVGLTIFDLVVLRRPAPGGRLAWVAGGVAVAAYVLLVPLTAAREQGAGLGHLLNSGITMDWAGAAGVTAALAVIGVLLMWVRPRIHGRPAAAVGLVGAAVALTSVLPVGHTRTFGPRWLVMGSDLVHASAAAIWVGGLVALVMHLARARRREDDPVEAGTVVARFSALAGGVVVLVSLAGTVLAVVMLGSVSGLVETLYGRLLLLKLAVVAMVGAVAVYNRFRLVPRLSRGVDPSAWRLLTRVLRLEVAGLVLVLCVTSVLTLQNPRPSAAALARTTTVTAVLGTGHLTGQLTPGTVGANVLTFDLTDAGGRPILPLAVPQVSVAEPDLTLGPLAAVVTPASRAGSYRAEVTVPAAGQWQVTTAVRVSELEQPAAVTTVVILQ